MKIENIIGKRRIKIEEKKKMKICNYFSKILARKIWSQKFQYFLILET